ncbi:NAD(P)/FAD-dependent oxidoreductase [Nakamurella alba]|uniref:NAD(P)/FAD-dependent oxidoreductase n=1 Tax=Nakamurella alba TaxID=2665158 RepID=UPI0018A8B706|nr:FAD-dependent oxidoreductase [Nakamurella alba]
MDPIVVVGAGHAGAQLAVSLRESGYDGPVLLLGGEGEVPYQRPPLSKAYLHGGNASELPFRPAEAYAALGVDLETGVDVTALDQEAAAVVLADGRRLRYSTVVLATGAEAAVPPLPGTALPGVHTLVTRADADALSADLAATDRLVVIGGGVVGLEVATTARKRGLDVVVIEATDRLMGRMLGADLSRVLLDRHRAGGVDIRLDLQAAEIVAGADGRVAGVRLVDGVVLPAGAVLIGIGARPRVEVAAAAGLAVDGGVLVDQEFRTADPRVRAIGDCAAVVGPDGVQRYRSVQNATDQARRLAALLTGALPVPAAVPWFWSEQAGCRIQIAGDLASADRYLVRAGRRGGTTVFGFRDGVLVGAESVDDAASHLAVRTLLAHVPPTFDDFLDPDVDLRDLVARSRSATSLSG